MTELDKIKYARDYVEKMANGINPLNGKTIPDGDLLNNIRISRCLFYVSDILRQVVEKGGLQKLGKRPKKATFQLSCEELQKFPYSEEPISISELTKRANGLIDTDTMSKLNYRCISDWLVEIGLLCSEFDAQGRRFRKPTVKGEEFGLSTVQRRGENGEYTQTVYSRAAQQFIMDNLDSAIELYRANRQ